MVTERKAWQHQIDVIPIAVRSRYYALFWSMGAGKTYTSIQVLRHWFNEAKRVKRTLILGPVVVVENWKREITQFSKFGSQTTPLVGTGKKRVETFKKKIAASPGHVFITNYQSLLNKALLEELIKWKPEVIVFDEIHRLKSHKSKMAKAALTLSKLSTERLALTGTPILNSPLDLYFQCLLLDHGKALGKNYFVFMRTYFYDANAGMPKDKHFPKWIEIPGKRKELQAKISHMSSVVKKEECMSLPPLVQKTVLVPLGTEQRRAYNEIKKDFITTVGNKACTADLAITKALRMQQVVSGYMPISDDLSTEVHEFEDNPRIEVLNDLLETIGRGTKVIIWAVYHANYAAIRRLCERRKIRYVEVHGQISANEKQKNIDLFVHDPGVEIFLGHPMSAGIGINLVVAPYAIFYSRNFSLEQSLQAEARNHRGGSEIHSSITRIDLVAENTIEEQVVDALLNKRDALESILEGIKNVNLTR